MNSNLSPMTGFGEDSEKDKNVNTPEHSHTSVSVQLLWPLVSCDEQFPM